jgi:hypothetical protein
VRAFKRTVGLLSVVGAVAALALGLTGCDTSPYAATVNGQVITVAALNHQLAQWASNQTWVQGFNQANSQSQGGDGTTVAGTGGAGTYNSKFAAAILSNMVGVTAVSQHLKATGNLPTQDEMVASRAVNQYLRSQYWTEFPQDLRTFLVQQLAEQGALAQVPANTSQLQGPYSQIQPYLFSKICVLQASAFSQAEAQAIVASGTVNGAQVCYDQATFEEAPAQVRSAVQKLTNPGDVSPAVPTSYGFVVLKLVSRDTPGFSPGVQRVLVAATSQVAAVTQIINTASVKVNPAYGTWSNGQVSPPKAPLSS